MLSRAHLPIHIEMRGGGRDQRTYLLPIRRYICKRSVEQERRQPVDKALCRK